VFICLHVRSIKNQPPSCGWFLPFVFILQIRGHEEKKEGKSAIALHNPVITTLFLPPPAATGPLARPSTGQSGGRSGKAPRNSVSSRNKNYSHI